MEEKKYDLIAFTDKGLSLDVRVDPDEDTVWLTKDQMALLFDRDRSAISRHISNIFNEGEASKDTSVHFLQISGNAANHRPPQLYNLDVIISVFIGQKSIESLSEVMRATRIVDQKSNSNDNIDHFHFCWLHFGY